MNIQRHNSASSVGHFMPLQTQSAQPEESMSLIVQVGGSVVGSVDPSINSNTVTVSKTPSVFHGRSFTLRDTRLNAQGSPQMIIHRPSASNSHVQLVPQSQVVTKPSPILPKASCIVKVSTPNLLVPEGKLSLDEKLCTGDDSSEENIQNYALLPYHLQTEDQRREILKYVLQDHNYGAPPPASPPLSPSHHVSKVNLSVNGLQASSNTHTAGLPYMTQGTGMMAIRKAVEEDDDDANSVISSNADREAEPEGEETETAPEGEDEDEEDEDDSVTRCVCDFVHDDGYMICCDKCLVWQHVDCMGIDRSNIPEVYMCEKCQPRKVDKSRARALQMRKREELLRNDTSSDSSSSSAEADIGRIKATTLRKRRVTSSSRRRNENSSKKVSNSTAQVLTSKRQRRDSTKESNHQNSNSGATSNISSHRRGTVTQNRKKEIKQHVDNKRILIRRKVNRNRHQQPDTDEEEDMWERQGSTSVQQLRHWIDHYEEAVTNHYSPELRARISSIKVNGIHSDLKTSTLHSSISGTSKCKISQQSSGIKVLAASTLLSANLPVIELRGKYMLANQHRPSVSVPSGSKRSRTAPGSFLFFYKLPKDGTEVCVDATTYGNDARFVRRSCRPNAEVRHCIEKGTLHLYIVTTTVVEKHGEITINHDFQQDPNSQMAQQTCACGSPKDCTAFTKKNGLNEVPTERERRRRGRRNTSSEEFETPVTTAASSSTNAASIPSITLPQPSIPAPVRRNSTTVKSPVKVQVSPTEDGVDKLSEPSAVDTPEEKNEKKKKLTREERKMEAIMKAFERMEKAQQRKQENQAKHANRKDSDIPKKDFEVKEEEKPFESTIVTSPVKHTLEKQRRKRRRGRGRTNSISQSTIQTRRRTRMNSGDSDLTSADEFQVNCSGTARQDVGNNPGSQDSSRLSTAAGVLLALANGNTPGSSDNISVESSGGGEMLAPVRESTPDPGNRPSSEGGSGSSLESTPTTPLSSACLLVAAAVGPLAPGFKFPKTKKVLMNEWLNKPTIPPLSPYVFPPLHPLSSYSTSIPSRPIESTEIHDGFGYPKPLTNVVQAQNLGVSSATSPQRPGTTAPLGLSCIPGASSAKKRWLRQAISEECDSPTQISCSSPAQPDSPSQSPCPPEFSSSVNIGDYVTPLKKRRVARESVSSERSGTPPTTPTATAEIEQQFINIQKFSGDSLGCNTELTCDETSLEEEEESTAVEEDEDLDDSKGVDSELFEGNTEQLSKNSKSGTSGNSDRICAKHLDDLENNQTNSREMSIYPCAERTEMPSVNFVDSEKTTEDEGNIVEDKSVTDSNLPNPVISSEILENEKCSIDGNSDSSRGSSFDKNVELTNSSSSDQHCCEDQQSITAATIPAKRKLSISEYRQRKRNSGDQLPRNEETDSGITSPSEQIRKRSNSTSSSSSISSDDTSANKILSDTPAELSTLPLFSYQDGDEKKGGAEDSNYMRWNSAPTLVERQRENLTERLRREFGLFLSDDEDQERAKKQGLSQDPNKESNKKRAPPLPPPPPPPHPPPENLPVHGIYSSSQKLLPGTTLPSYPLLGTGGGITASYMAPNSSNFLIGNTSQSTSNHGSLNGPAYNSIYPAPLKSQGYGGYSVSPGGKTVLNNSSATTKNLVTPSSSVYSTLPNSTPKPFLLPTPPTPTNAPFVYPSQVVMMGSGPGTASGHYSQTAQTGSTFYTAASAKAYYPTPSHQ